MPGGRRGLVAPQNTFLENIIRRSNSQRESIIIVSLTFISRQSDRLFGNLSFFGYKAEEIYWKEMALGLDVVCLLCYINEMIHQCLRIQ